MFKLVNKMIQMIRVSSEIEGVENIDYDKFTKSLEMEEIKNIVENMIDVLDLAKLKKLTIIDRLLYKLKYNYLILIESYKFYVRKGLNKIGGKRFKKETLIEINYLDKILGGATEEELKDHPYIVLKNAITRFSEANYNPNVLTQEESILIYEADKYIEHKILNLFEINIFVAQGINSSMTKINLGYMIWWVMLRIYNKINKEN